MIKETKQFKDILQRMYELERINANLNYSFEKLMQSNLTRLNFLNKIFRDIKKDNLSNECRHIFDESIDFIFNYLNGNYSSEIEIPEKYNKDKNYCLIVPTQEDIQYLFSLIDLNVELYNNYYKDNEINLELPKNSFNMNMERVLVIKWKNLSHLLGLTQTELVEDKNKNLLKKYILSHFNHDNKLEDSSNLLNILLTKEGRNELLRINQLTIDFIKRDKQKNPNSYDIEGNIKKNSFESVRDRFKKDPKNEGLDFPIIRYSRYITKCINNINFFNMDNINQMILDYNAPIGENVEKDIFVLSANNNMLEKNFNEYFELKNLFMEVVQYYGTNKENNEKIEKFMFDRLIPLGANDIESKKSEIRAYLNMYQTKQFIENQGINPDFSYVINKIRDFLGESFKTNIHLIGFGTETSKNESGEIKLTGLNEKVRNFSHCDTSIFLNVAELIDKFYKRGRAFFIDKISTSSPNLKYIRISNPIDELSFLRQMELMENKKSAEYDELLRSINLFNKNYEAYKKQNNKIK